MRYLRERHATLDIEVDGGVGPGTIKQCAEVGVDVDGGVGPGTIKQCAEVDV